MTSQICVSVGRGRHRMMLAEYHHLAEEGVELVELRLDYIRRSVNMKRLLEKRPCPIIATCRRPADGGKWRGTEQDRVMLLRTAIADGVDYVDLEMDVAGKIPRYGSTKRIVSYHNFQQTPDNLPEIHEQMLGLDPDVIKIATMAHSPTDNLQVLRLCRDSKIPTAAFCMGEMGTPSRILCGRFGSPFTYATFSSERRLAPGMLSFQEMRNLYRYGEIKSDTEVFGVIADPVEHSLSPLIHNRAMREAKMNRIYLPFRVPREYLGRFMSAAPELGIRGLSVTIPHKEEVLKSLNSMDEEVAGIQAANTVVFKDKKVVGYNTDCKAAIRCILRAMDKDKDDPVAFKDRRFLLLGSGGVARAIGYGLHARGAAVFIAGRNVRSTEELANHLDAQPVNWMGRHSPQVDAIINCTPIGMHPNLDETPFEARHLSPTTLVFDTVYNPEQTLLIKQAREKGCPVITGVEMFVRQAALQFKLFTGEKADQKLMLGEVKRAISAARY